jgi:tocopherol cyclase
MANIWKPGVFQGKGKKKDYFEGWYFKCVSDDEKTAFAIIPGLSLGRNTKNSHAFIMIMDARNQKLHYFKYLINEFKAEKNRFEFSIGNNLFSDNKLMLDILDGDNIIKCDITFKNIIPWPVKIFSPGAMGWYAFMPFMECYHGILSFDHSIEGFIEINGIKHDFTGGKGYIEKDWGSSMPSSWIWMQTNHFDEEGISLFGSIAKIPWLRNYFTGYLFGLLYNKKLYRLTTYNGAKINKLNVTEYKIEVSIQDKNYLLEIDADRAEGVDLPAPSMGEMTSRVNESLKSRININFYKRKKSLNELILSGTGRNAGLEFVGDINELLEGFKKEKL